MARACCACLCCRCIMARSKHWPARKIPYSLSLSHVVSLILSVHSLSILCPFSAHSLSSLFFVLFSSSVHSPSILCWCSSAGQHRLDGDRPRLLLLRHGHPRRRRVAFRALREPHDTEHDDGVEASVRQPVRQSATVQAAQAVHFALVRLADHGQH